MRALSRTHLSALLVAACVSASHAIRLTDFLPAQVDSLPPACEAVYQKEIAGCSAEDFPPLGDKCSDGCINGLFAHTAQLQKACSSVADSISDASIIGIFLLGLGPQTLCSGNSVPGLATGGGGFGGNAQTTWYTDSVGASSTITVIVSTFTSTSAPPPPETTTTTTSPQPPPPPPGTTTTRNAGTTIQQSSSSRMTTSQTQSSSASQAYRLKSTVISSAQKTAAAASFDADDNRTGQGSSGGGSPFDFPVAAASTNSLQSMKATMALTWGLAALIMLL